MIPVTEAVVQSPQFTVHIIMLFFWTGFSVLMNMHVFFLEKKHVAKFIVVIHSGKLT